MTGWGDGISNIAHTDLSLTSTVYAKKTLPSVRTIWSRSGKTHTTKFGFYWGSHLERQPGNAAVNGSMIYQQLGIRGNGTRTQTCLIGQTPVIQNRILTSVPAFRYITAEFYGGRFMEDLSSPHVGLWHALLALGPWSDTTGYGLCSVWYPELVQCRHWAVQSADLVSHRHGVE